MNCIITSFNPLATEGVGGGRGSLEPQAVCFCYFFIFAKVLQGVASMQIPHFRRPFSLSVWFHFPVPYFRDK